MSWARQFRNLFLDFEGASSMNQTSIQQKDQALVPHFLFTHGDSITKNLAIVGLAVGFLSLLAQISIQLPWTPVPITGQTFGVALIALSMGRKRAVAVVLAYLTIGSLGAPVFALGKSGLNIGPTSGYLIGMVFSSYWMGFLADKGWTKTYLKSWFAATSGSLITFGFGLLVLSYYIPSKGLLAAGLLPFIPGDAIKTVFASAMSVVARRAIGNEKV
jgi:biotin transport system substrate-specific component